MESIKSKEVKYNTDIFGPVTPMSSQSVLISWFRDMLRWWYITMPIWYILSLRRILTIIDDQFSISLLISNFFVAWHRDNSPVGFFMGIIMKILFLPIGILVFILTAVTYILFILIWFALPILTVLGIVLTPLISAINQ